LYGGEVLLHLGGDDLRSRHGCGVM
jgi:hypothetical protein